MSPGKLRVRVVHPPTTSERLDAYYVERKLEPSDNGFDDYDPPPPEKRRVLPRR